MITKHHFHYINDAGVWTSACSFRGYRVFGEWRNHDAGEFDSPLKIRHRHELALPQRINCKTCLKHPKLKKLLEELSPWPDSSLKDERYAEYCRKYPQGSPRIMAFHAARKKDGRYIDDWP